MPEATLDQWRKLYDAAQTFHKQHSPKWFGDAELVIVRDTETGTNIYTTLITTDEDDDYLMTAFLGEMAFLESVSIREMVDEMLEEGLEDEASRYFGWELSQLPHLYFAYREKDELGSDELNRIRALGVKPKKKRYPSFGICRPGFVPALIWEADQVRLLTDIIEQVIVIQQRNKSLTWKPPQPPAEFAGEEDIFIYRVQNAEGQWEDRYDRFPEPPELTFPIAPLDERSLQALHRLPRRKVKVELDMTILPFPYQDSSEADQSGFYPILLAMVDARSGEVYFSEFYKPMPTLADLHSRLPQLIINQFAMLGFVPSEVYVVSDNIYHRLNTLASRLKIKVIQLEDGEELPKLGRLVEMKIAELMVDRFQDMGIDVDDLAAFLEDDGSDEDDLPPMDNILRPKF